VGDGGDGASGSTTQGRNSLGKRVDVVLDVFGNLVEQLVKGDEVGPFTFQCACLA